MSRPQVATSASAIRSGPSSELVSFENIDWSNVGRSILGILSCTEYFCGSVIKMLPLHSKDGLTDHDDFKPGIRVRSKLATWIRYAH